MNGGYLVLILICALALYMLILNLVCINKVSNIALKVICSMLFIFSMTRYITLIVYGNHPSYELMESLRVFYMATSIGLTISLASATWYGVPLYKEKISYIKYILCFTPWILFYSYVMIKQPTQIVQGQDYGYLLQLNVPFQTNMRICQESFGLIMVGLSVLAYIKYKNLQFRIQYILLIIAQMLLVLDGQSSQFEMVRSIPPFTLTEVFGFFVVYYIFGHSKRSSKA